MEKDITYINNIELNLQVDFTKERKLDNKILENIAKEVRKIILKATTKAKSGHPGGSLSSTDIITYLYFEFLKHNPQNPKWPLRDRFVLSKGHAAPALYAVLALCGYFPVTDLNTLRQIGSHLQGHPDMNKTPGVDMTTGSLGHGIGAGVGMALGLRLSYKDEAPKVIILLGDGETQEGSVWEAFNTAAHYNLSNVCIIMDNNNLQIDGRVDEIMNIYPLMEKLKTFGFNTIEIDGHDFDQIRYAFSLFRMVSDFDKYSLEKQKKTLNILEKNNLKPYRPTFILAKTIKGKGISFMENEVKYHGKPLSEEELKQALMELI